MGTVAVLGGIWEIASQNVGVYLVSKAGRACQSGDERVGGWGPGVKAHPVWNVLDDAAG